MDIYNVYIIYIIYIHLLFFPCASATTEYEISGYMCIVFFSVVPPFYYLEGVPQNWIKNTVFVGAHVKHPSVFHPIFFHFMGPRPSIASTQPRSIVATHASKHIEHLIGWPIFLTSVQNPHPHSLPYT